MRTVVLLAAVAALAFTVAGCGKKKEAASQTIVTTRSTNACANTDLPVVSTGKLTVGTDNPAYPPWFGGGTVKGSKWKVNDPSTGKGFESAVTYAVAKQLGFKPAQVTWKYVPFSRSFAPGTKPFDFDINQISYTPARAKVVDFSNSYYDVNQAVVVKNGTKIASAASIAALKPYKLGAQLGSTSYDTITSQIGPDKKPAVFPSSAGPIQALKNGQIDGLVVDLPTAFYVTAVQVPNSKVLGQFPAAGGGEHFGMVLAHGSELTTCLDAAIARLSTNGTLARLQDQWLSKATGAPVLK